MENLEVKEVLETTNDLVEATDQKVKVVLLAGVAIGAAAMVVLPKALRKVKATFAGIRARKTFVESETTDQE